VARWRRRLPRRQRPDQHLSPPQRRRFNGDLQEARQSAAVDPPTANRRRRAGTQRGRQHEHSSLNYPTAPHTRAGRSPQASSKAPAATSSRTERTSPAPAGDCAAPKPSSNDEPCTATVTGPNTGPPPQPGTPPHPPRPVRRRRHPAHLAGRIPYPVSRIPYLQNSRTELNPSADHSFSFSRPSWPGHAVAGILQVGKLGLRAEFDPSADHPVGSGFRHGDPVGRRFRAPTDPLRRRSRFSILDSAVNPARCSPRSA